MGRNSAQKSASRDAVPRRAPYRLVVFDFDGTLADSFHVFVAAVNAVAPGLGLPSLDRERLEVLRQRSAREMMADAGLSPWTLATVARAMQREMRARMDEVRPFPGVFELLTSLVKQDVKVALVTSNALENVRRVLGHEAAATFATMSCGASILGKAPRMRRVLATLDVAPAEALCVGDELRDADAADTVGATFLAVAWGYTLPAALAPRSIAAPCQTMDAIVRVALDGPTPNAAR